MKIVKTLINYLLLAVLLLIIVILSYALIKKAIKQDEHYNVFGYYLFEVSSGSMYKEGDPDSLNVGALIFVKEKKNKDYEVGDTVTYQRDSDLYPITHRIEIIEDDLIYTKGINPNNSLDEAITQDDIIGKVRFKLQHYRLVINFFSSVEGILILIMIVFIIFLIPFIKTKKIK